MGSYKELIINYFEIRDRIDPIVTEILNKTKVIEDVPLETDRSIIQRMITLLNNKKEYFENKTKIEAAVHDYMNGQLLNKKVSKYKISNIHKIKRRVLSKEIEKALIDKNYRYDRQISKNILGFSYLQEELLLEKLQLQFTDKNLLPCSCRICFFLKLSTFGYEFAKSCNIKYPNIWDTMTKVDFQWLQEFEMRHSSNLSRLSKNCLLQ